jgi:hypothetical protein
MEAHEAIVVRAGSAGPARRCHAALAATQPATTGATGVTILGSRYQFVMYPMYFAVPARLFDHGGIGPLPLDFLQPAGSG